MDDNRRAFYEYHAAMMEPWDGPAAMAFTDGRHIGGTLDRNGLRPARYIVTDDDLVVMASESGVLPIPESKIINKWRLQPGKMFLIDLEAGRIRARQAQRHAARSRSDAIESQSAGSSASLWLYTGRLEIPDVANGHAR
jgi:glutamine phosphoribosylpyrophosphate amidotransferase